MAEDKFYSLDIPESKLSLWCFEDYASKKWFGSFEEVVDFLDSDDDLSVNYNENMYDLFGSSFSYNLYKPVVVKYDYLGDFAGESDVFMLSYFDYEKTEEEYTKKFIDRNFKRAGYDTDHIMYTIKFSNSFSWSMELGSMNNVYGIFREKGIIFKDDIYEKKASFIHEIGKKLQKTHPNLKL